MMIYFDRLFVFPFFALCLRCDADCGDVPAFANLIESHNARGVISVNIADQTLKKMHSREKGLSLRLGFCLLLLILPVPGQLTEGTLGSLNIITCTPVTGGGIDHMDNGQTD
jgi:hypothetical protein